MGTPFLLCPLMIIIERARTLIRPITLAIRLVANITIGHLVMALMGARGVFNIIRFVFGVYVLYEFFVCGLQAYVFSLLVMIYSGDHPSDYLQKILGKINRF